MKPIDQQRAEHDRAESTVHAARQVLAEHSNGIHPLSARVADDLRKALRQVSDRLLETRP